MKNKRRGFLTLSSAAIVALTLLLATSCKKEHECHCIKTAGGDEEFMIKAKKDDAKAECEAKSQNAEYKECHLD